MNVFILSILLVSITLTIFLEIFKLVDYRLAENIGQDLSVLSLKKLQKLQKAYFKRSLRFNYFVLPFAQESNRIIKEIDDRKNLFYKNFSERMYSEITKIEKTNIDNVILSDEMLIFLNKETLNLIGEVFIFFRYIERYSIDVLDFKMIGSISDYMHEIPFQLKVINSEKKLTFSYYSFLKSFSLCCNNIITEQTLQENEYIHFFKKFYSIIKGIIDRLHFTDGIMLRAPTKDGSIAYICASGLGENDRVTSGQVQVPQSPEMVLIKEDYHPIKFIIEEVKKRLL